LHLQISFILAEDFLMLVANTRRVEFDVITPDGCVQSVNFLEAPKSVRAQL